MKKALSLLVALALAAVLTVANVSAADYYIKYDFAENFTEAIGTTGPGTTVDSQDGVVTLYDNTDHLADGSPENLAWVPPFGIGNTWKGDYIVVHKVAFGTEGAGSVTIQASNLAGQIDKVYGIYIDSIDPANKIASLSVKGMMSWDWKQDVDGQLTKTVTGTHDVFIVWETDSDDQCGSSIWGISFTKGEGTGRPVETTSSTEPSSVAPSSVAPSSTEPSSVAPSSVAPSSTEPSEVAPSTVSTSSTSSTASASSEAATETDGGISPIIWIIIAVVVIAAVVVVVIISKKKK